MANNEEIENLVSNIVENLESGAMLTKYVFLAEGIDPEGKRAVYMGTNKDATTWDVLGLLIYAFGLEQANLLEQRLKGEL